MTDMVRLANIHRSVLPPEGTIFNTADSWYKTLPEMHITQLMFQHDDVVVSEDDCRNKYVARQIFRRLAIDGKLSTFGFSDNKWSAQSSRMDASSLLSTPSSLNNFRLWGDDFRAGNILLNDSDEIVALIDWEFTSAAPTQFCLDPPWWLLLETTEMWSAGMDDWVRTYNERLQIWLSAMKKAEADMGEIPFAASLSAYMQQSWETGRFFLTYAARKSWAFDAVYWKYLDGRFFDNREGNISGREQQLWQSRVHLLTGDEKAAMEPFVERKMAESRDRRIVDWDPEDARRHFSELLFD